MPTPERSPRTLPAWLWCGLPIALWLAPYVGRLGGTAFYERWIVGEFGLVEGVTALALIAACGIGAWGIRGAFRISSRALELWIAMLLLGCVYFAGEELSWGQHLLRWETPEPFRSINEQVETNFHNTEGWVGTLLDQVPRFALTLAAFLAGGLLPLIRRGRPAPAGLGRFLWPTIVCAPAALLAVWVGLPEWIAGALGEQLPTALNVPDGEMKECFLALFLLFYMASIAMRLRDEQRSATLIPAEQRSAAASTSNAPSSEVTHAAMEDSAPRVNA